MKTKQVSKTKVQNSISFDIDKGAAWFIPQRFGEAIAIYGEDNRSADEL